MIDPHNISSQKIAAINDLFRSSLGVPTFCGRIPGQIVMTAGVAACSPADQTAILRKVRDFNSFPEDDDPYGEHDFGDSTMRASAFFGSSTTTPPAWNAAAKIRPTSRRPSAS
jgi:Protein of unknown function (DUF3768)